jgi:catechol 2,3-dioxygenase-like lactoylglutathione lyase family enzyme
MDWKLELVFVPVSDVDRAKDFYVNKVGFNADFDERPMDGIRFVQLTPPGSACSISIGEGLTDAPPGSAPNLQIVVNDIQAAHDHLKGNGVEVSDIDVLDWGHFVYFADPDGNKWAVHPGPRRPKLQLGQNGEHEPPRCHTHPDLPGRPF